MNLKLWQIKNLAKFIFLLIYFLLNSTSTYASDNFTFSKLENKTFSQKNSIKSQYLLGEGDGINIKFYGIEVYDGFYVIDPDGFIYLPEIGSFYAKNYTIQELTETLTEEYKKYIINPDLQINLAALRPITVYISGEVRSPGVYTFKSSRSNIPKVNPKGLIKLDKELINNFNVRLFDAIKSANGVNNYADLANIKVIRKNSRSQGGGKITAKIDLLSSLTKGDFSQNIRLYDKDYLIIPKNKKIIKKQLLAINNINLKPVKIKVYVTGNVINAGEFIIDKGSSLTQAIASTGGKKLLTGNIEFLRFNDDGSTENYSFKYNNKSPINSKENPILMSGDIINVKRTILGSSTEIIKEVASPILRGYGLYKVFD